MLRFLALAVCLALTGCMEESSDSGRAVAAVQEAPSTDAANAARTEVALPILAASSAEPEDGTLASPLLPPPDEILPPPSPEAPAPEPPASGPTANPVLVFSYLRAYFDPFHDAAHAADMQRFHRAQVYAPFADRSLDWFGRDKGLEYETAVGIRTNADSLPDYDPYILRDAQGRRLFFDFACNGSQCTQYADNPCSPAVNELRLARMQELLVRKGYRGLWLDNVDFAKPNGKLSISDGSGHFVRPVDPDTGQPMTNDKWNQCMADWLELVRTTFPAAELAHNSLWFAVRDDAVRRQHQAADYIHLERGFIDYGIVAGDGTFGFDRFLDYLDWVHSLGTKIIFGHDDGCLTEQEFQYALAAYFLVREAGDLFGTNDTNRMMPGNWDSRLDSDLGAPLGPRYGEGPYSRDFECGSVTVWGPPERRGQITRTACQSP